MTGLPKCYAEKQSINSKAASSGPNGRLTDSPAINLILDSNLSHWDLVIVELKNIVV